MRVQNRSMRIALLRRLAGFVSDDRGQDLIELAIVLAFVALGSTLLCAGAGVRAGNLWAGAGANPADVYTSAY